MGRKRHHVARGRVRCHIWEAIAIAMMGAGIVATIQTRVLLRALYAAWFRVCPTATRTDMAPVQDVASADVRGSVRGASE